MPKPVSHLLASLMSLVVCGVCSVASDSKPRTLSQRKSSVSSHSPESQRGSAAGSRTFSLDSIDDVLWWLPEDTETVSVVRGPFKAVAPLTQEPANASATEYLDWALRALSFGPLQTIETGRFYRPLIGRNILFCVEGSRRYRAPTSLGGMLYEGCNIIVVQPGLGPERAALIRQMTSAAKRLETIEGQRVMVFEEKLEQDIWKILIAMPSPDVMLCATNRDYLAQVLKRMQQKGPKRALPEDLPEWKHVNTRARFWAVRHYDKADAPDDPSSPLSGEEPAASWQDEQAIGMAFDLDPITSRVATVKFLSANRDALKLLTAYHARIGEEFKPEIRQKGAGVVEMLVSLDDPQQNGMFLFVLLSFLGHATFT